MLLNCILTLSVNKSAMFKSNTTLIVLFCCFFINAQSQDISCIRINQLGYTPQGSKVAVLGCTNAISNKTFSLVDDNTKAVVFTANMSNDFGEYGPFKNTYRLDFSSFKKNGKYFIRVDTIASPAFAINEKVYDGAADFCLRYMRQQRSGFNPFLKDSCHTHDGYTLYATGA